MLFAHNLNCIKLHNISRLAQRERERERERENGSLRTFLNKQNGTQISIKHNMVTGYIVVEVSEVLIQTKYSSLYMQFACF